MYVITLSMANTTQMGKETHYRCWYAQRDGAWADVLMITKAMARVRILCFSLFLNSLLSCAHDGSLCGFGTEHSFVSYTNKGAWNRTATMTSTGIC